MAFNNYSRIDTDNRSAKWLYKVFGWMSAGLSLSAVTSYLVATTPAIHTVLFTSPFILTVLFIGQVGLVIALSAGINRMSFPLAATLFMIYSLSMGFTLSSIFLVYTLSSIFATFLVTAGMFAAMALYGFVTDADLSSMGSYLLMGLFGLIIGWLVNFFLQSDHLTLMLSYAGVVIFTLLTAYDVQRIKQMAHDWASDRQTMQKVALLGALTLYLDFVNLFIYLLNVMGKRKN